jgi:hypothetical protein
MDGFAITRGDIDFGIAHGAGAHGKRYITSAGGVVSNETTGLIFVSWDEPLNEVQPAAAILPQNCS